MNQQEVTLDLKEYGAIGYVIVKDNTIYCPAIMILDGFKMREIFDRLVKETGINKVIFTAVCSPFLKQKLHNIKREYDIWFEEIGDYSHCIEVEWIIQKEVR
jgi:hypothetical protein